MKRSGVFVSLQNAVWGSRRAQAVGLRHSHHTRHELLPSKLHHYGLNESECNISILVANYFMDCYHRVKLGCVKSYWLKMHPRDLLSDHLLIINIVHCNDLIVIPEDLCNTGWPWSKIWIIRSWRSSGRLPRLLHFLRALLGRVEQRT